MKNHLVPFVGVSMLICLLFQACGGTPANQPVSSLVPTVIPTLDSIPTSNVISTAISQTNVPPTIIPSLTPIKHLTQPGTPTYISVQLINDCTMIDSTGVPIQPLRLFTACDIWKIYLLERPFTADLKTYTPYLDIQEAQFGADANWFYARIHPVDVIQPLGDSDLNYMLEFDLNSDGINDILVASQNLRLSDIVWTTSNVHAWSFKEGNVTSVFDQGLGVDPDLVWVRRTPGMDVEFAFKPSLLNGDSTFAWWVWAFQGVLDPAQFIPINTLPEMYQIDSTCSIGFNIDVPGLPNQCR